MICLVLFTIFLTSTIAETSDYPIENGQCCTHNPFKANFNHNCSRTRLMPDVSLVNDDRILYISIILNGSSDESISLSITKMKQYEQRVTFIFFTEVKRNISFNNQLVESMNEALNAYVYLTSSNGTNLIKYPYFNETYNSTDYFCELRNKTFLTSENISRIYYLHTNETNLDIDLSISSYHIAPFYYGFEGCFHETSSLSTLAIILIVLTTVFSFITVILLSICLKKQLIELYHIFRNWSRSPDSIPTVLIHGQSG